MRNSLLLAAAGYQSIIYSPITFRDDVHPTSVTSTSIPSGTTAGDLILGMVFDSSSLAALASPWVTHESGDEGGNGAAAIASFVYAAQSDLQFPQTVYPWCASFGNAQFARGAVWFAASGQAVTFPALAVTRPKSAIICAGFREATGGAGTVTFSVTGSSELFQDAPARQFACWIPETDSNFAGGSASFTAASSPCWGITAVLEPIA